MAINGVYIVQGEMNAVVTTLRRGKRYGSQMAQAQAEEQDPILRNFSDLRDVLNTINELSDMSPNSFLSPFLDVIRSEHTAGPVTGLALSSVGKFLSYGLIDPGNITAPSAVENIAEAVTHARFVGTDPNSDEVVLLRIVQVLKTLLLTPVGSLLTNESVCEIMQSCFRICFEIRLSELLRKVAEYMLMDMIQLLFTRLPTFKEDPRHPYIRKLQMRAEMMDPSHRPRRRKKYKKFAPKEENQAKETTSPTTETAVVQSADADKVDAKDSLKVDQSQLSERPSEISLANLDGSAECASPMAEESNLSIVVDVSGNLGFGRIQSTEDINSASGEDDEGTKSDPEFISCPPEEPDGVVIVCPPTAPIIEGSTVTEGAEATLNSGVTVAATEEAVNVPQIHVEVETPQEDTVIEGVATSDLAPVHHTVSEEKADDHHSSDEGEPQLVKPVRQRVNKVGVKFTTDTEKDDETTVGPLVPYGLPCIRELLRFLISMTNPLEKCNTEQMIVMGLNLVTVALEAGADYLGSYTVLMPLIRNELCRSLFLLIASDKLPLFAASLRVCFLMFESLRTHLKFQMETYFTKLMEIIVSENPKISYEQREMALDAMVQLWRIPGLVTELYLNYDCDLYCGNLFEDITKLLSKNSFPITGLYSTHILSLDALLTIVDTIETNCHYRMVRRNIEEEMNKSATQPAGHQVVPPASGYTVAKTMGEGLAAVAPSKMVKVDSFAEALQLPQARPNRMPISQHIPSHEDLVAQKKRKRLLAMGTELFNQVPSKGISFLQDHSLFQTPLNPHEVVTWLKENPRLDKKQIGEYVTNRKNAKVLEAFVKSFPFQGVRIDDALRMFLETFRLPGEAPVISMLLEHFASHWFHSNDEPFANVDAAFTLAYAVIMLNVDQHNTNAKKQIIPMRVEEFKRNCRKVNGGGDFDQEMLEDIYGAIKSEEIVMPAEHSGIIKENYMWKVLLKRGMSKEGRFIHAPSGLFDHDLFQLIWSPTIGAISCVFDKSTDDAIVRKAISGFRKCAAIAAHYEISDVFDNLIVSLCKFSMLTLAADSPELLPINFGENQKAQLAARTLFQLIHTHGDILRDAWKNVLDCLLQLYKAKLLPKAFTEVEDFVDAKGWVSIVREKTRLQQKSESGLFSSIYSYFGSGSEGRDGKTQTTEELELIKVSQQLIADCTPENLFADSKYLTCEALAHLITAIVATSASIAAESDPLTDAGEDSMVFFLELLVNVILENKDRLMPYWKTVRDHFGFVFTKFKRNHFLLERGVVGILRLGIRLLFREEIADEVLQSLELLLFIRPSTFCRFARHIAFGLHELLRSNAANIHMSRHWSILFLLLECAGAAAFPERSDKIALTSSDKVDSHSDAEVQHDRRDTDEETAGTDVDRGYISDSELERAAQLHPQSGNLSKSNSQSGSGEWLYVDSHGGAGATAMKMDLTKGPLPFSRVGIVLRKGLKLHDSTAYLKCCDAVSFIVRDAAHITPDNFEPCVSCLRAMVEACVDGGKSVQLARMREEAASEELAAKKSGQKGRKFGSKKNRDKNAAGGDGEPGTEEKDAMKQLQDQYVQVSLQLLDLAHTLHVKAANIYKTWADATPGLDASPSALWAKCWCPLLQTIARLCSDHRRQVRMAALTYLQRALLIPDLQGLTGEEWESCFSLVLFPLLSKLLTDISPQDPLGMEEARVRATTLLCKVFLQHLYPLYSLPTFLALWMTILEFMELYIKTDRSDLLSEAIPESLKNMLLVMETASIFDQNRQLYHLTKDRMATFLPGLLDEVLPGKSVEKPTEEETAVVAAPSQDNLPTSDNQADVSMTTDRPMSIQLAPEERVEIPLQEVVVDTVVGSPNRLRSKLSPRNSPRCQSPVVSLSRVGEHSGFSGIGVDPGQSGVILHPPTDETQQIVLHPPVDSAYPHIQP